LGVDPYWIAFVRDMKVDRVHFFYRGTNSVGKIRRGDVEKTKTAKFIASRTRRKLDRHETMCMNYLETQQRVLLKERGFHTIGRERNHGVNAEGSSVEGGKAAIHHDASAYLERLAKSKNEASAYPDKKRKWKKMGEGKKGRGLRKKGSESKFKSVLTLAGYAWVPLLRRYALSFRKHRRLGEKGRAGPVPCLSILPIQK